MKERHVLLIEDHSVSQFKAANILESFQLIVDKSETKSSAIEKLKLKEYEIIFIDFHILKENDFETSRFIRNELNSKSPIIALTENPEDLSQTFTKEMLTFLLSKPFTEEDLHKNVTPYLKENYKEKTVAPEEKLYDLHILEKISDGDNAFIAHTIQLFINNIPESLNKLEIFAIQQDWKNVRMIAHSLHPSVGFMNIRNMIGELKLIEEYAIEQINPEKTLSMIQYLKRVSEKVIYQLKSELANRSL